MFIRIINGTFGYRPPGSRRVIPKRPGDKPFEVSEEIAGRLVNEKIAVYAAEAVKGGTDTFLADAETGKALPEITQDMESGGIAEALEIPEYSTENTGQELREIAEKFGVSISAKASKAEMVDKLDRYFDQYEEIETVEDGEAPPSLSAEVPE